MVWTAPILRAGHFDSIPLIQLQQTIVFALQRSARYIRYFDKLSLALRIHTTSVAIRKSRLVPER